MRRLVWVSVPMVIVAVAAACDLTDVAIVDFADIVVAEVYVTVADTPVENSLRALIHGAASGSEPSSSTFDDALVTVTDPDGMDHMLLLSALEDCVISRPESATGSCFVANFPLANALGAGDALALEIALADGRVLSGSTRIPGDFAIAGGIEGFCRIPPDTLMPLHWSPSDSAWAYVSEALILDLKGALVAEAIEAPDSLSLMGLSISESDTTIVFPSEFGVFDRFDLDHELAVRLQRGLPAGARAEVAITAVDRNYVNWVRGGSFNPSGTVRVSSLTGGTGVFGSAVTRRFTVLADTEPRLRCPGF
jgi:hypothetical protein